MRTHRFRVDVAQILTDPWPGQIINDRYRSCRIIDFPALSDFSCIM
jgi:hypothetical protein